jgi:hypothetical protein
MATAMDAHGFMASALLEMARLSSDCLALPFDVAREQYAKSVRAGLVERSLIASARFERTLSAIEGLTLGVMARRYQ